MKPDLTTELVLGNLKDSGDPLNLDLDALIGSHLCIEANSGAGKSGAIRKVLETTHGQVQHIVLDTEDEFYTLREKFEYLIAGGDNGDCASTVNNASALAMMILETGFSAIVQMNGLSFGERCEFFRRFLGTLTAAPKNLWRPALVVIDEAQFYAPQKGAPVSLEAIISFMLLGRKRGFTGILATPRPADLSKEATSPVNNWMIGRCGQPVDRRSAADALGFPANSAEARNLRSLVARQFWVFGPALTVEPVLAKISETETTIVKAGQATVPTPPAPAAMRKMLESLNAAAKAAEEAPALPTTGTGVKPAAPDPKEIEEAEGRGYEVGYANGMQDGRTEALEIARQERAALADQIARIMAGGPDDATIRAIAGESVDALQAATSEPRAFNPNPPTPRDFGNIVRKAVSRPVIDGAMPTVAAKIVDAIDMKPARAFTWTQIAMLAGYSESGGQFRRGKKWLLEAGTVIEEGGRARIAKPTGKAMAPTGAELVSFWNAKLPGVGASILDAIWTNRRVAPAAPRDLDHIAADLGYAATGGQFRRGVKALRDARIVDSAGGKVSLTSEFLELAMT
jgi:hypothetical protein